jgi:hypothetical protein
MGTVCSEVLFVVIVADVEPALLGVGIEVDLDFLRSVLWRCIIYLVFYKAQVISKRIRAHKVSPVQRQVGKAY